MNYKIHPSTSKELVPQVNGAIERLLQAYEIRSDSPQPLNVTGFVPKDHNSDRPTEELEVIINPRGRNFLLNHVSTFSSLGVSVTHKKNENLATLVSSGQYSTVLTFDGRTFYRVHHTWHGYK